MACRRMFNFWLLLCLIAVCGCEMRDKEKMRIQLIQNAITSVPTVAQFHALYPQGKIEVYSENFKPGTTLIAMEELIYDRYLLRLHVNIEIDRKNLNIKQADVRSIILEEILSVSGDPNGPSYHHGQTTKYN